MYFIRPQLGAVNTYPGVGQPQYLDGKCVLNCTPPADPAQVIRERCADAVRSWATQYPDKARCVSAASMQVLRTSCERVYAGTMTQAAYGNTMLNITSDPCAKPPAPDHSAECYEGWKQWLRENPQYGDCITRSDQLPFSNLCSAFLDGKATREQVAAAWEGFVVNKCGERPRDVPQPPAPPLAPVDMAPPPMVPAPSQAFPMSMPSGDTTSQPSAQGDSRRYWWFVAAIVVVGGGAYLLR